MPSRSSNPITTDAQARTQADKLARRIRDALGQFNDENEPVVNLIGQLVDRLSSTSPAPDGWVLVGYGMRSNVDGSISREFVPAGWTTTTALLEKFHQEPWVVNGRASIVSFYAAPQPVVEKDHG